VKEAKQELIVKQRVIDATSAQLLALQLQYGCSIGTKKNQSLEAQMTELKKQIKGNYIQRDSPLHL
jgi:hypothetical protein